MYLCFPGPAQHAYFFIQLISLCVGCIITLTSHISPFFRHLRFIFWYFPVFLFPYFFIQLISRCVGCIITSTTHSLHIHSSFIWCSVPTVSFPRPRVFLVLRGTHQAYGRLTLACIVPPLRDPTSRACHASQLSTKKHRAARTPENR